MHKNGLYSQQDSVYSRISQNVNKTSPIELCIVKILENVLFKSNVPCFAPLSSSPSTPVAICFSVNSHFNFVFMVSNFHLWEPMNIQPYDIHSISSTYVCVCTHPHPRQLHFLHCWPILLLPFPPFPPSPHTHSGGKGEDSLYSTRRGTTVSESRPGHPRPSTA